MSDVEHLAPEVLRFIGLCIPTVPHLEAALLMWETAPQLWSAAQVSARIYVVEDDATQVLRDLERCGIAQRDIAQPTLLMYNAASEWAGTLPVVSNTYRRHLIRLAQHIHSQSPQSGREFSRAFWMRKEQ